MKNTPYHLFCSYAQESSSGLFQLSRYTWLMAFLACFISPGSVGLRGQVPKWEWVGIATCAQGTSSGTTNAAMASPNGGYLLTGSYYGDVDLNPGPGSFVVAGGTLETSAYVSRFDSNGNFKWARHFESGGPFKPGSVNGECLVTDVAGNIFVGGQLMGYVDFDPGPDTAILVADDSVSHGFICKLDSAGQFRWVRDFGHGGITTIEKLHSMTTERIVGMGTFRGTVDLDPGPGTHWVTANGHQDLFVLALDPGGNLSWARTFPGKGVTSGSGLTVDQAGDIYLTGTFQDSLDADPGPMQKLLTGGGAFLIKLSGDGDFERSHAFGGPDSEGRAVEVDAAGNVWVAGAFRGMGDFDPGPDTLWQTSVGSADAFIMKFSPVGDLTWARRIGSLLRDEATSLLADGNGMLVSGLFNHEVDFDPGPGMSFIRSSEASPWSGGDLYVIRLNADGNYQWVLTGAAPNSRIFISPQLVVQSDDRLVIASTVDGDIHLGVFTVGPCNEEFRGLPAGVLARATNRSASMPSIGVLEMTDVSCAGDASGSIHVTAAGGQPGYTFTWSNGAEGDSIVNLKTGQYHVTVTDAQGAQAVGIVRVEGPKALMLGVDSIWVHGATAGGISITIMGGVEPYQYLWTGPDGKTYDTEDLDGLTAFGIYQLTVTDANGCMQALEVLLEDTQTATGDLLTPLPLRFYPNPANDVIHIQGDLMFERIEVFGIDGRPCLQVMNPIANQLDISGLPEGCYQVRATDGRQWYAGRVVKTTE